MCGRSSQLPTTTECAVVKSFSTVQTSKQCLAAVGSWEELPNDSLMVEKNITCQGVKLTFFPVATWLLNILKW